MRTEVPQRLEETPVDKMIRQDCSEKKTETANNRPEVTTNPHLTLPKDQM